jgi:iron complex outermembrane receptor protein
MRKTAVAALCAGTILSGIIIAAPAQAQDVATPVQARATASDPSDIIVTARRVQERLQDVPISITVYNQQQLTDRNIASTVDLATYTPSLAVNGRFGPDKSAFVLRGFSTDPLTAPTVAVYFADVVAPRSQASTAAGNGASVGSLMDLQNVQVLKGPQGTLFGRNTTGGAILIVPQKPTSKFEGYLEGTYGNYNAQRLQGAINLPLSDTFRMRLAFDRNTRDGYLRNRRDLGGVGPDDFNNINYYALRLSAVADLAPNLENYTIATYSHSDTHGTVGKPVLCNAASTSPIRAAECAALAARTTVGAGYYDVANSVNDPFERQNQWQIINTTTWQASDTLTIKNIASYAQVEEFQASSNVGDAIATPFVESYPGLEGPEGNMSTFTEELQFQGRTADDRLTWQTGGYMEMSDPLGQQSQYTAVFGHCSNIIAFQCTVFPGAAASTGSVSVTRVNYRFRDYGAYAQGTFKITDRLSATAGIRYTWDSETSRGYNYTVRALGAGVTTLNGITNPNQLSCTAPAVTPTDPGLRAGLQTNGSCFLTYTIKSDKPTWMVDLDYKPVDDVLLYAKYARGYRAGGLNPSAPANSAIWRPESIDSYEIGVKTSWHGAVHGTVNVSAFYNTLNNQQLSVSVPQCTTAARASCTAPATNGINGIQNAGVSRIQGIEADVSLDLFRGFRLDAAYAYLDAKVTKAGAPTGCDNASYECSLAVLAFPAGSTLPFSPKNRITVTGTYTLPVDESVGKISLGATFTHTDSQYYILADAPAFNAGLIPYDPGHLPTTDLVNLNLNWEGVAGSPVDLSLFVTNLTQDKYWVSSANGLGSTGAEFVILGEPRMFGGRLKVHFGK